MYSSGRGRGSDRIAMGTGAMIAIIIIVIIAAGIAYFLATSQTTTTTSSTLQTSSSLSSSATLSSTMTSSTTSGNSTMSSSGGTNSTESTVSMPSGVGLNQSLNFSPASITVVIGVNNTIVWTNNDNITHTVTSTSVPAGATSFDSGNMAAGKTFKTTLTAPGTYQYHCTLHPSWMKGTIIVIAK